MDFLLGAFALADIAYHDHQAGRLALAVFEGVHRGVGVEGLAVLAQLADVALPAGGKRLGQEGLQQGQILGGPVAGTGLAKHFGAGHLGLKQVVGGAVGVGQAGVAGIGHEDGVGGVIGQGLEDGDLGFAAFTGADVAPDGEDHLPAAGRDGGQEDFNRELFAVQPTVDPFEALAALAQSDGDHFLGFFGGGPAIGLVSGGELGGVRGQDLLTGGSAQHFDGGLVAIDEEVILDQQVSIGGVGEKAAEEFERVLELAFEGFVQGDVAVGGAPAAIFAGRTGDGLADVADPARLTVAGVDLKFDFADGRAAAVVHFVNVSGEGRLVLGVDDPFEQRRVGMELGGAIAGDALNRGRDVEKMLINAEPVFPVVGEVGDGAEELLLSDDGLFGGFEGSQVADNGVHLGRSLRLGCSGQGGQGNLGREGSTIQALVEPFKAGAALIEGQGDHFAGFFGGWAAIGLERGRKLGGVQTEQAVEGGAGEKLEGGGVRGDNRGGACSGTGGEDENRVGRMFVEAAKALVAGDFIDQAGSQAAGLAEGWPKQGGLVERLQARQEQVFESVKHSEQVVLAETLLQPLASVGLEGGGQAGWVARFEQADDEEQIVAGDLQRGGGGEAGIGRGEAQCGVQFDRQVVEVLTEQLGQRQGRRRR